MTLRSSRGICTVRYTERDLRMLDGPFLREGSQFVVAAGVYANFTVAGGQNAAAVTEKRSGDVLAAAQALLRRLSSDRELLQHDYKFSIVPRVARPTGGGVSGLRLEEPLLPYEHGCTVGIDAGPPGQIYLTVFVEAPSGWHEGGALDMRLSRPVKTNRGLLRVHQRGTYPLTWLSELPNLIALLPISSEIVQLRHHFVGDAFDTET
jgi:hypothetical protein